MYIFRRIRIKYNNAKQEKHKQIVEQDKLYNLKLNIKQIWL